MTNKEIQGAIELIRNYIGSAVSATDLIVFSVAVGTLEKCHGWIPVGERLPEPGEHGEVRVLVSMDDDFVETADYTTRDGFCLWEDAGEVVAWQPLPEPYVWDE